MIGCLQFLCHRTRPDISTAVGILSQFSSKPTASTVRCVKRIFGYLKSTRNYGLKFDIKTKTDEILKFFSDADFAGNKLNRKSRSGWLAKCYGFMFLWNSRRQNCVSLSTPEAEYIALCDAACELKWIRMFSGRIRLYYE